MEGKVFVINKYDMIDIFTCLTQISEANIRTLIYKWAKSMGTQLTSEEIQFSSLQKMFIKLLLCAWPCVKYEHFKNKHG